MALNFSTIRCEEVFLWEMLPYSVSLSSLFPSLLFINLFHVLKLLGPWGFFVWLSFFLVWAFLGLVFLISFCKEVDQVIVLHDRFYKNLKKLPLAILRMGSQGL